MPKRSRNSAWKRSGTPGANAITHAMRSVQFAGRPRQQDRHHRAEQIGDGGAVARQRRRRSPRQRSAAPPPAPRRSAAPGRRCSAHWCGTAAGWCSSTSSPRTPSRRAVFTPHQKYWACGQQTPFETPGRARRVQDRHRIAGIRSRASGTGSAGAGKRRARPAIPDRSASPISQTARSDAGTASSELTSASANSACNDQQLRLRVRQDMRELRTARRGVDRHRDRADPAAAEIDLQQFRPVAAHHRDVVAALDAGGTQRAAEACRHVQCIRETPGLAADVDQSPVAVQCRLPAQHAGQRAFVRRQARRQIRDVFHMVPFPANGGRAQVRLSARWVRQTRTW